MYQKKYVEGMDPLEVYYMLVKGTLKKFPNGFLDKDIVKLIVRHVILDVYQYDKKKVIKDVGQEFLRQNFLGGARKFFGRSHLELLIYCFPEWDLKLWNFARLTPNFWKSKENRKEFLIWLAEKEGLDLNKKEDLQKITAALMNKYGASAALKYTSMFELLDSMCEGKYKEWEIVKGLPWNKERARVATKWLIEEKLKLSKEQVCHLTKRDFEENDLSGMLQKACGRRIINALELAYPGVYFIRNRKIALR